MKIELIQMLTATFEGHAQQTENGVEYWLARDLQHLLGYVEWRNFSTTAISKAKTACEVSGHSVADHFVDVNKMVDLGSGSQREIDDLMLSRYACYLIAQNGDPRKPEIAFAQTYFAIQTRRAELIERRLLEAERVSARRKLSTTEKELSDVIFEQTGGNNDFALIRSKGDQALKIHPSDESSVESPGQSPAGRLRPDDHSQGQRLRHGDHDLQCTATWNEQRVCDFARACHQQSGSSRHVARTRHPSRVIAGGGRCEEGGTAAGDGGEEVAQESGRAWCGGCVMSVGLNDAQARELEQGIAAIVAGILEA